MRGKPHSCLCPVHRVGCGKTVLRRSEQQEIAVRCAGPLLLFREPLHDVENYVYQAVNDAAALKQANADVFPGSVAIPGLSAATLNFSRIDSPPHNSPSPRICPTQRSMGSR